MSLRIYTRTGDDGSTGLFGGQRVAKNDLRVEAYGSVDELNSVLGTAVAQCAYEDLKTLFLQIQSRLFDIGADLATPFEVGETKGSVNIPRIPEGEASSLEPEIDRLEAELEPLRQFILPGGCALAAALHVARTVCRRAERCVVTATGVEDLNPEIVRYLNRLSDLLFTAARAANCREGVSDIVWTSSPGGVHA